MRTDAAVLLIFGFLQQSCPSQDSAKKEAPPVLLETQKYVVVSQRFVPMPATLDVAFDTQTGQICRTWDWANVGGKSQRVYTTPDGTRYTREDEKRTGAKEDKRDGEFAPTCLSLYQEEHAKPAGNAKSK